MLITILATGAASLSASGSIASESAPIPSPNFREMVALTLRPQDESEAPVPPAAVVPFGAKDSWRWFVQGAFGYEFNDESEMYLAGVGVSYFLADDLSIDLELNGFYVDQDFEEATVGNFNLLLRWHFLAEETWSLYFDGGAGLSYATEEVPRGGSQFNFTPQFGMGTSFDIGHNARLLTGVRWHHMSNARTKEENPGRDALMVYAQVSFPF